MLPIVMTSALQQNTQKRSLEVEMEFRNKELSPCEDGADQKDEATGSYLGDVQATRRLLEIDTLRPHPQIVFLREWVLSQAPWRRSFARKVSRRILDAA